MRQYAIPLIDSFALSDHIVNSPLGKWDGSVYESYFAQVQASNPLPKVHPYFERLIKPLLERKEDGSAIGDVGADMDLEGELEEMRVERAESEKVLKERKASKEQVKGEKVKKEYGTSGAQQDQ